MIGFEANLAQHLKADKETRPLVFYLVASHIQGDVGQIACLILKNSIRQNYDQMSKEELNLIDQVLLVKLYQLETGHQDIGFT